MQNCGRVLFKDGMFLEPHHFQLFERLQTAQANARVASLSYGGFQHGFTELEIDRDALLGGNFTISRASGIFSDGSIFEIRGLSRSFASYCPSDQLTLDVYLAVPIAQRYVERMILLPDEFSRNNNKEIEIGEPNYLIRFEGEPLDGCIWLRIARLTKTGSGFMENRRDYAPPVLFMRVSDVLKSSIGGLLELLWARIGSLAQCRRQNEFGQAFFSSSQENSYRLFNTLCTFTPLLSRLHELPKIHPYNFHTLLTALYGSLQSFSPSIMLEDFPPFDHDNPAVPFIALAERIREALKVEFWTDCTALELEQADNSTWFCRFPGERFAAGVNLFIGISANVPQKALLVSVLQQVKVASRDKLDFLISSSIQGLTLVHAQKIPEGLAAKQDYVYFIIDRQGPYWEGVEASGALGIHFSGGGYPNMKIEVLALKRQDGFL